MRSRIVRLVLTSLFVLCITVELRAQASCENPLEYLALTEGNVLINAEIRKEIAGQSATAVFQNQVALEFQKIREWEGKYCEYTKTVSGYASALNAASHIYDDALRIMLTIGNLSSAMSDNPQGIVATMSMNGIYVETVTELMSCITLFRDAVAKGGTQNMLTGAERSRMLWAINDKMEAFAKKLQKLYLCVRYYQMMDVWDRYSAGMVQRSNGQVARRAHQRWTRAAKTSKR